MHILTQVLLRPNKRSIKIIAQECSILVFSLIAKSCIEHSLILKLILSQKPDNIEQIYHVKCKASCFLWLYFNIIDDINIIITDYIYDYI